MRRRWTEDQSLQLWNARPWTLISRDDNLQIRRQRFQQDIANRQRREQEEKIQFQRDHASMRGHMNAEPYVGTEDAGNLQFWAMHGSTTYCLNCQKLLPVKLLSMDQLTNRQGQNELYLYPRQILLSKRRCNPRRVKKFIQFRNLQPPPLNRTLWTVYSFP